MLVIDGVELVGFDQAEKMGKFESGEPTLLPQTITIQQLDGGWFITSVVFQNAPAFCS